MTAPRTPAPRTIAEYLDQLRAALAGADPALVQDALYDAEEYLRSELAEHPEQSEAEVIAAVAGSYGAPEEFASIYRDMEVRVQTALRPPVQQPRRSALGRFFGVAADPRTYSALFYLLLALATGIFYFVWVVAALSASAALALTIIGIPLLVLFFGSVRILSLVEGRLVEVMLGERMPRRPPYADRERPLLERIKGLFTDPRMWSTLLYFVLMLPLGISYFVLTTALLTLSLASIAAPLLVWTGVADVDMNVNGWYLLNLHDDVLATTVPAWGLPALLAGGVLLLFVTLHVVRGIGRMHGALAKQLLVKAG